MWVWIRHFIMACTICISLPTKKKSISLCINHKRIHFGNKFHSPNTEWPFWMQKKKQMSFNFIFVKQTGYLRANTKKWQIICWKCRFYSSTWIFEKQIWVNSCEKNVWEWIGHLKSRFWFLVCVFSLRLLVNRTTVNVFSGMEK